MAATSNSATGPVVLGVIALALLLMGPPPLSVLGIPIGLFAGLLLVVRLVGMAAGTHKDQPPG